MATYAIWIQRSPSPLLVGHEQDPRRHPPCNVFGRRQPGGQHVASVLEDLHRSCPEAHGQVFPALTQEVPVPSETEQGTGLCGGQVGVLAGQEGNLNAVWDEATAQLPRLAGAGRQAAILLHHCPRLQAPGEAHRKTAPEEVVSHQVASRAHTSPPGHI